jgi:hypothetical protein
MAISVANAVNEIAHALATNSSRLVIDKASLANQVAGRVCAMWRATGQPAQGAIPTTSALCTHATLGAFGFTQQTAPMTSYIALLDVTPSNSGQTLEFHDRIAHQGGLSLNVNTSQTTNLPLDIEALNPGADRLGDANFSDLQWWLEVYADGGATASNATINVTYGDNTSENLTVLAVGGTIRIGHRFSLNALRPVASQSKYIKRINSVILSAATGTVGNFGFTVTRPRAYLPIDLANRVSKAKWTDTGLSEAPNGSCLEMLVIPSTTSSGTLRGGGKIIHA